MLGRPHMPRSGQGHVMERSPSGFSSLVYINRVGLRVYSHFLQATRSKQPTSSKQAGQEWAQFQYLEYDGPDGPQSWWVPLRKTIKPAPFGP